MSCYVIYMKHASRDHDHNKSACINSKQLYSIVTIVNTGISAFSIATVQN